MNWVKKNLHNRGKGAQRALLSIAGIIEGGPSIEDLQALAPGDLVTVIKAIEAGVIES